MTDHRNCDGSTGSDSRSREEKSNSCGGRRSRQHGSSGRYGRRKERVLHTRVSEQLSEDIRRLADDLRVPVSNLVRNVLEEVFTVVENVTDDVGDFFEDVVEEADGIRERIRNEQQNARESAREARKRHRTGRRRGSRRGDTSDVEDELKRDEAAEAGQTSKAGPTPAAEPSASNVLGWQPIVLNQAVRCGRCEAELASGANAMMGITSDGSRAQVVCPGCAARN